MLPLASDDQGDGWLNAQPSAQPMLGPRGLLLKASCWAPSDRGPDQPLPPALIPHPLLFPPAGTSGSGGAAFLVLSDPWAFLRPQTFPARASSSISPEQPVTSLQGWGVCVCVTITPGGPPGKREVEVAGMRENRLTPSP